MPSRGKRSGLLNYHRPLDLRQLDNPGTSSSTSPTFKLKPESRRCLQTLASYVSPRKRRFPVPKSRSAAVLVALFIGRKGDLYVLLSRRAATLRTYAGDTSLPGGKWDDGDRNLEWTARREAFEEIGLPLDRQKVPFLCYLEPHLAGNQLVVTPVVVLVLDNTIKPILNEHEVDSLFSHPLQAFLQSETPFTTEPETLETEYSTYYSYVDMNWPGHKSKVRGHRFLTGRETGGTKPIFGITAAILIQAAMIGYEREPDFELYAPNQPSLQVRILTALRTHPVFREAAKREGIDPDKYPDPESLTKRSIEDEARKGLLRFRSRL